MVPACSAKFAPPVQPSPWCLYSRHALLVCHNQVVLCRGFALISNLSCFTVFIAEYAYVCLRDALPASERGLPLLPAAVLCSDPVSHSAVIVAVSV